MQLTIVIPCLNEKNTIIATINSALGGLIEAKISEFEILIADNGSDDGTLSLLKPLKKYSWFTLLRVPIKGYGSALHHGISQAKFPYILFADADMSYPFFQLRRFVVEVTQQSDLILGSRFLGQIKTGAMPFLHRYLGTPTLTFLIRLIYKIPTTDCNSGMRLIKKDFYQKLKMKSAGMEWASELLIKTKLNGGNYQEIPIIFFKDQRERKPHLNSWADGWRHLKVIALLRPKLFWQSSFLLLLLSFYFSIINNLNLSIGFFLISQFLFFSFLVLKKLQAAIDRQASLVSQLLDQLPLVLIGLVLSSLSLLTLFFFSNKYATLSYIVLFEALFYDIWLFFIETIKTHLVNRLPDDFS